MRGTRRGEVAEHDRGVDRTAGPFVGVSGEVARAGVAAGAAAGGDEHDGALGLAGGEDPGELEQDGGRGELGGPAPRAAAASRWATIAIGGSPVRAGPAGDDGGERARPSIVWAWNGVGGDREAASGGASEGAQFGGDVGGQLAVAGAAGAAVGEARGEALQFGGRAGAVEGVGREVGGERRRAVGQREPGDREREQQRQEGGAIDSSVEHARERP